MKMAASIHNVDDMHSESLPVHRKFQIAAHLNPYLQVPWHARHLDKCLSARQRLVESKMQYN